MFSIPKASDNSCCAFAIPEASLELHDHYKSLKKLNFTALLLTLLSSILLVGIEVLVIMTYFWLPAPVIAIPSNILNVLQLVLLVGSGLIAYKLLTVHTPAEDTILENLVRKYDGSCNKGLDERVGEILGEALKKYIPPEQTPQPSPIASPLHSIELDPN